MMICSKKIILNIFFIFILFFIIILFFVFFNNFSSLKNEKKFLENNCEKNIICIKNNFLEKIDLKIFFDGNFKENIEIKNLEKDEKIPIKKDFVWSIKIFYKKQENYISGYYEYNFWKSFEVEIFENELKIKK